MYSINVLVGEYPYTLFTKNYNTSHKQTILLINPYYNYTKINVHNPMRVYLACLLKMKTGLA